MTALIQQITGGGGSGRRRRDTDNPFANSPDNNAHMPTGEVVFRKDIKRTNNVYAVATFGAKVTPIVEFDSESSSNPHAMRKALAGHPNYFPNIFGWKTNNIVNTRYNKDILKYAAVFGK